MMNDGANDLTRRGFLKFVGASLAIAGLDGCTRMPAEKILPYVIEPPELTPGVPVHYATSMVLDGYATGLIVKAREGRPIKIEGNPGHPASLGATDAIHQASLLQLYDGDRATSVRSGRQRSSWAQLSATFTPSSLRSRVGARGAGLHLVLEPTSSPLVISLLNRLRTLYPDVRVYYYAPLAGPNEATVDRYDLAPADVILCVDADVLGTMPMHLHHARAFADRRRDPRRGMNRLYAIEPSLTVTGMSADERLRCRPSAIEPILAHLLATLGGAAPSGSSTTQSLPRDVPPAWLAALASDLRAHAGRGVVIAGPHQTPVARALAASLNDVLGNTGHTAWHSPSPLADAGASGHSIADLAGALRSGGVRALVCGGVNLAYAAPASLGLSSLLTRSPERLYLGMYEDETAERATWFVPQSHYLESWGDARAYDGTLSIVQPLVQPLYGSKSLVELLAMLGGQAAADPRMLLRQSWQQAGLAPTDEAWTAAVRTGFVAGSGFTAIAAAPRSNIGPATAAVSSAMPDSSVTAPAPNRYEVVFAPDYRVHDGRFANVGWLQELPDPITKLTWGNAALVSPATAKALGVSDGDGLALRHDSASLTIPALVVPGLADGTATVHFGYGRRGSEHAAIAAAGADAYTLWPAAGVPFISNVSIERDESASRALATTHDHWSMEGRDQARIQTAAAYVASSSTQRPPRAPLPTLFQPEHPNGTSPHQWAMTIDLGTCIGCSACVVACQAENNIPVVGYEDVLKSREMHWLRIDRYAAGPEENPTVVTQPMLCQHCEMAPCEYVCPVGATEHSSDGLNEMIYNRCVGTRFCSNNCPYKVRRFNWFDYNAELTEVERLVKNPDVTVRERGVMEKCTFCVQRIREAEIAAADAGTVLHGGDVRTACQQVCPTNAIVFGSLTEPETTMMQRRAEPRAYTVLEELGTRPRVTYLARIRNANPELDHA